MFYGFLLCFFVFAPACDDVLVRLISFSHLDSVRK